MRVQIKRMTTKIAAAILVAASVMSTAAPVVVRADEITPQATECVETNEVSTDETSVEGQGDVIDDCFAVAPEAETQPATETVAEAPVVEEQPVAEVEGQGDVIDDQFAVVEGQGDVIDDQFAVAPEAEAQPATETVTEAPVVEEQPVAEVEGQGDVIDDQFAVSEEEAWEAANEIRTAEMAKCFGEFGTVEMDLHNAEWYQEYQKAQEAKKAEEERAKQFEEIAAELNAALKPSVDAMIQARLMEDTKVETKVETKEETKVVQTKKGPKKVVAPAIHMDLSNTFFGYSGKEVDYKNLEVGKFYLMQIPKTKYFPNFNYRVVKILGSYTDKGIFFDDVMVKYNQYHWDGTLDVKNRKTQVNENLLTNLASKVPNHFFEITDDILVK